MKAKHIEHDSAAPNPPPSQSAGSSSSIFPFSADSRDVPPAALRSSLWNRFFDHSRIGIALVDVETDLFLCVNDAFAHDRGYTPSELIGHPFTDVVPEEMRARAREGMAAKREKSHIFFETRHLRKDGTVFPILIELILVPASKTHPALRAAFTLDLTERDKLEEALRESGEQLERIFDLMPVGVALINREYRIEKLNEALTGIMGLSADQLRRGENTRLSYIRTDGSPLPREEFPSTRIMRGEPVIREEEIGIRRDDASVTWLNISASPSPRPGEGAILVLHDVTSRKAAQKRGEYFARLYRTLSRVNRAIVRTANPTDLFHEVCRISVDCGRFLSAWIGMLDEAGRTITTAACFPHDPRGASLSLPDDFAASGSSGIFGECLRTRRSAYADDIDADPLLHGWQPSGEQSGGVAAALIPLTLHDRIAGFLMLHSPDGNIFKVAEERDLLEEMGLDISFALEAMDARAKRMEAVRRMAESEAKYRSLVDAIDASIFLFDDQGRIRYLNPIAARTIGTTPADGAGMALEDFLAPQQAKERREIMREVIASGRSTTVESELTIQGKTRWFQTTVSPVLDSMTSHRLCTVLALDISAQKALEMSLRDARDRAEHSDRLKEAFIASMSHEIRTPLNIILGFSSLLEESLAPKLDPDERTYFTSIHHGSNRLLRTIDQILTISRLRAGEYALQPIRFDVAEVAQQIVEEARPLAKMKSLRLELRNEYGTARMSGDRICLTQALNNLVDNAIKFTEEGTVTVRLYPGADRRLCIQVSDTGIGISREYLPHIFEPYSQEETGYNRPYEGIGLGLAITKQYLDLHGIQIALRSEKHVGTTATLTFGPDVSPSSAAPQAAEAVPSAAPLAQPASPETGRARILLVEDDPLSIDLIGAFLAGVHDLRVAMDADTAWEILHDTDIDLVLLDISIRGSRNGLDLTREIRGKEHFASLPVIALTAHAFTNDRENCLKAGCDDYLAKPVGRNRLLDMIASHLSVRTAAI